MKRQFTAKIENANEVADVINTALHHSEYLGETIYLMSNGEEIQIIQEDYKEEFEELGYWVAGIYEYGHRVEA